MQISLCEGTADARRWDEFVETHVLCGNYHRWKWKQVIENSFGWNPFYLMAEEGGQIRGILPLVWQKSWLGNFVSSVPLFKSAGIVAETPKAQEELLEEAIDLAKQVKAEYLELRYCGDPQLKLPAKTSKVTFVLPLERDEEKMWKALSTKMRTKIRKSMSFGLSSKFGGREFLDDFYAIFSENMRDLGTPVYGRRFFLEVLDAFPEDTHLCIVRHRGKMVAASFLSGFRDTIEALWSSSIREYLSLKPNLFLYWKLLCFAGERGYRSFDFGRSSIGSGTHEFKMQWRPQIIPLHWVYWLSNGDHLPEVNAQNPKFRIAIRVWQRLPLALTRKIGPWVVRFLPS